MKSRWKQFRSTKKCYKCRVKAARTEMHKVQLEKVSRPPKPLVILRNLLRLVLGHKPEHIGKRAWLFGNDYMKVDKRMVNHWVCFNCYIQLLTPVEYQQFREGYYFDMVAEDGEEKAGQLLGHMDAVFAAREESS